MYAYRASFLRSYRTMRSRSLFQGLMSRRML
jgi:hypothetical protein